VPSAHVLGEAMTALEGKARANEEAADDADLLARLTSPKDIVAARQSCRLSLERCVADVVMEDTAPTTEWSALSH